MMEELLKKLKQNLIVEHGDDDDLLRGYLTAAISYAESYQHISAGSYTANAMPATTEQAVIMLAVEIAVVAAMSKTPLHRLTGNT